MDNNIGVGLIVGLAIATTLFAVTYDKFTKTQKIVLFLFIIFPPLQWVSIIALLIYNHFKYQTSEEGKENKKAVEKINKNETQFKNLKELRDSRVLTKEEYEQKIKNLENTKRETQLKLSEDYKKLKSLYDDGILTKEEFESKLEILRKNRDGKKAEEKNINYKKAEEPKKLPIENRDGTQNLIFSTSSKINKLKNLKNKGILTQEEYDEKFQKLYNLQTELEFKKSQNYLNLKSLYSQGVLTEEEFQDKSEKLLKEHRTNSHKQTEIKKLTFIFIILILVIAYPFILGYIFEEFYPFYLYNPDWRMFYWGLSILLIILLRNTKNTVPVIIIISIIYTFLTNSTINL